MEIKAFFDPRTELNTWNNFKELNWKQKGVTLLVSAIAAVIFPLYGGFVAFRALTHYFHKIDSEKTKEFPSPFVSDQEQTEIPDPTPLRTIRQKPMPSLETMSEWKQLLYRGLSKDLGEKGLKCGGAEESGDCLFDAVSQQLSELGIHKTKKQVREDIKHHLETCEDDTRYRELLRGDLEHSYETFCERIGLCAEDIEEGAPIWGNKACMHMIADIYHVKIESYAVCAVERTLAEEMDDPWEGCEKYQFHRGKDQTGYEVCTKMDENTYTPSDGRTTGTIRIGNLSRGGWGHFVPVVPRC